MKIILKIYLNKFKNLDTYRINYQNEKYLFKKQLNYNEIILLKSYILQ